MPMIQIQSVMLAWLNEVISNRLGQCLCIPGFTKCAVVAEKWTRRTKWRLALEPTSSKVWIVTSIVSFDARVFMSVSSEDWWGCLDRV